MNSKVVKSRFDRTAAQSSNKNIATITACALCGVDISIVGRGISMTRRRILCKILMLVLIAAVCVMGGGIGAAEYVDVTLAGSYDTVGDAKGVAVSGNYAYVADRGNGLVIVDISDPASPVLSGSYDTVGDANSVAVSGNYAYVADGGNGFVIVNISNPASPVLTGSCITGYAYDVSVSGNYAYVAALLNGLVIVDISNPASPLLSGSSDAAKEAIEIDVSGNYAYVADDDKGLVIVNISNPASPVLSGSYDTAGFAQSVAVSGNYAYIADWTDNDLVILNISNPASPFLSGSYDTPGYLAGGVAVSGNYAYVVDVYNGLLIIDINNPAFPALSGNYNTAGSAWSVAVSGNYAYVADGDNGLVILRTDASSTVTPVHNIIKGTDYTTIQAAIDDASTGDEIHVDSGTYYENVDVNKQLTLRGIDTGAGMPVVDAGGSGSAITLSADGITLDGVKAVNSHGWNEAGIKVTSNTNIISGNDASYNDWYGICLDLSNNNIIIGNIVYNNSLHGVSSSGNDNTISSNIVSNNSGFGMQVFGSTNNDITENIANNNNFGIYLSFSSNNNVTNNIVNSNKYSGIYLDYSGYNTIRENNVSGNNVGINLDGIDSVDNMVYHNNLIKNNQNAAEMFKNFWNNSYPSGGNHWSDYIGDDLKSGPNQDQEGSDSIGDTPYNIPGGSSVDRYPLMNPWGTAPITRLPPEITRSRLGINTHWNHWAENLSIYKEKTKDFGIVRDQAWWAGLETSDLTGSEWDHANWNYSYDTETLCGKEISYQSGHDNLVKLYQDEDSPELLLLLNLKNDNISSFETITADQYYDYVYHVVERYDGDGQDDMPGLISPIRPIMYFEVGNEVDYNSTVGSRHGYLSPKDYVEKRLIPAYNAAKAANKDAVIMGCGLGMGSDLYGNDGQEFNTMYLDAMYDNITKNGGNKNNNFYMDKIAIHYYAKPNAEFDKNIKKVDDVIQKYENRDKPIWITEFYPLTEIGQRDTTTGAFARLLTLMFANRIEMPVIYNLKDDLKENFGLYNFTCEGDEETITPRESIQVIDTVLSTLHGTTPSETENENISIETGKTIYQRVFNNSEKKVTVLWYIDTVDPSMVTNCVVFPESSQTFTVDVLGTANFSHASPIHLEIGSEPTYVIEADLPIDVDLYFNRTTTAGVSTERAASFAVGDTLYGKIKTSASTDHLVKTYITMTMPDGTCRYAYYDKPDFTPGIDRLLFSDEKVQLYDGVWHATTDDWLWNIYEFTGSDSGIYAWNCWYEDSETGEILGGNCTEYTFSTTPSGTSVDSSTGKGEVYLDSSAGTLENFIAISPDDMPAMPASLNPVYGFFSFNITGISGGQSVNILLAFPDNVPTGTEYWKYGPTPDDITPHWYQIPVSDDDGDRIIVITLTDGGIGDDDLTANSMIIDDGGPSLPLGVHNIDTGDNFPTIQTAIDDTDTQDGHTITVDAGTYVENVNVNKRVTLIGNGADVVTVQAADAEDYVFEVTANWVNISGFTMTGATHCSGIYLNNTIHCYISDNNASNNNHGIWLYSSSNNVLLDNTANSNNGCGVGLCYSRNNTLVDNIVNSNNNDGIYLDYNSNNNTLYHNNFLNNTQNAHDSYTNQWDSGSEGNYYSDYTGIDSDGDGIGDIPYNISGGAGAQDRYPLMQPWNESGGEFISIGSASAPTNSTVTIPVSIANVENISGISFDLLYNSSVATVSSVSANTNFTGTSITPNIDNANGITSIVLTNLNLISASAETNVIDIVFNITGGFGSYSILDLQNVEFSDVELNPYTPAVVVDGLITIGIIGDLNNNGRVDIGDVAKVAFMVAGIVQEELSADFNDNGYVDIGDAAKIAFYLAGKVDEL